MPWKTNVLENDIIELEVNGQITLERAIEQAKELVRISKEHNIIRFIINTTDLHTENKTEIGLSELLTLPGFYTNMGLPKSARIALVLPITNYRLDDINFLASAFMRSGYFFALLKNKESAIQFLIKEEDTPVCGCGI